MAKRTLKQRLKDGLDPNKEFVHNELVYIDPDQPSYIDHSKGETYKDLYDPTTPIQQEFIKNQQEQRKKYNK
jgi:hypothetical protein